MLTELPVMYESPLTEYYIALKFAEPEAFIPNNIVRTLQENCATPHFYSDGSCHFQNSPNTRFAAYSLVADLCINDDMRAQQANMYIATGKFPDTLVKIGAARCGGEQHIGRAELWPITISFQNFTDFILHTDSAYCVDTVDKIQHCTKLAELSNHSEFDLVRRIFNQPKCNQQVVKIAAHKDTKLIQNPVERYHCLGNTLADKSAVDMCLNGEVLITKQFQEFHSDHKQQETHLRQLFDLHLCLQKERAKVSSMQEIQPVLANEKKPAKTSFLEDSIRQWRPQGPLWEPPDVVTRQWLEFSAWGRQVSFVILQWLLDLTWGTTDDDGPNGLQMGLSWTEVAISISLTLGAWLPIRRQSTDNNEHLVHPQSTEKAKSWGVTLSEMSQNAYLLVTQVQTLVPEHVFPSDIRNGKVNSLQQQGYHAWTTGFKRRPQYPYQNEVFDILQSIFKAEKKPLQTLPDLDFRHPFILQQAEIDASTLWEKRYKLSLSKAKIVAKQRKISG